MVERAHLTSEFINQLTLPEKGERWISDTAQPGFGIRLWRTKSGNGGIAYSIRVSNPEGVKLRATFDPYNDAHSAWEIHRMMREEYPLPFGNILPFAREWARDYIDRAKCRLTIDDEDRMQRNTFALAARRLTFEKAALAILNNLKISGRSQAYIDRLDKLFHSFVPTNLKLKLMPQIKGQEIVKVLRNKTLSAGNMRIFRPFIRRVFNDYHAITGGRREIEIAVKKQKGFEHSSKKKSPVEKWSWEKFQSFFVRLESEKRYWQQAYCLWVFIKCYRAPLTRVMAAKWSEVHSHITPKNRGFFSHRRKKHYFWQYSDSALSRERLDGVSLRDIRGVYRLSQSVLPKSEYVFPSNYGRKVPHIRSVDQVWTNLLHELKLPYTSPNQFREVFQRKNLKEGWYWKYL